MKYSTAWVFIDLNDQFIQRNDAEHTFIRLSGKFVQLVSKRISETFGFCHSIEGTFLLRYTNFGPIASFPSYEKKNVLRTMCLHFSKMSNIEHRAVIMFFTRKGLNAIEISKELDNVYKNSAPSYRMSPSEWLNSRIQNVPSKIRPDWATHQPSLPMKTSKS